MTARRNLILLCLAATLLLSACGKEERPAIPASQRAQATASPTPTPTASPKPTQAPPSPSPTMEAESPAPADIALTAEPLETAPAADFSDFADIRLLLDEGSYYAAFQAMLAFEAEHSEPEALAACEALFAELDTLLQDIEPATGTEIVRSSEVQGGGVLELNAFSGPVLVSMLDAGGEEFVRFYVRQGEIAEIHVPAGTYRLRYAVGYRWFGMDVGFGEYCTVGELAEPLVFDFYMDGSWASNSKFTITI